MAAALTHHSLCLFASANSSLLPGVVMHAPTVCDVHLPGVDVKTVFAPLISLDLLFFLDLLTNR